jgi:hypothetical protein
MNNILSIVAFAALGLIVLVLLRYLRLENAGKLNSSDDRRKHTGDMMTSIILLSLLLCGFIVIHEYLVPRNPCTEKKVDIIPLPDTDKEKKTVTVDTSIVRQVAPDTTNATNKKKVPKVPTKPKTPVKKKTSPSKPVRNTQARKVEIEDPKNPKPLTKYSY